MRFLFFLLLTLILVSSCSSIEYRSLNKKPVALSYKRAHRVQFEYEGYKDFYFWGAYPKEHVVDLDLLPTDEDYVSYAKLKIEEYSTLPDVIVSFLTLGLYYKRRFIISGFASKERVD